MALTVYQLKVVLRDVKPAVWRRVLVPGDATIRTLHETVQVVMGWANCDLHQFIIHGKGYGVAYEGGISFADSPDKVRLSDFRFQPHEGFEYVFLALSGVLVPHNRPSSAIDTKLTVLTLRLVTRVLGLPQWK
jgi:hypothetical protein